MKVAAHPLVVAAALGLLGPAALAEEDRTKTEPTCLQCPRTAPDQEEMVRAEEAFLAARDLVDASTLI